MILAGVEAQAVTRHAESVRDWSFPNSCMLEELDFGDTIKNDRVIVHPTQSVSLVCTTMANGNRMPVLCHRNHPNLRSAPELQVRAQFHRTWFKSHICDGFAIGRRCRKASGA